MILLILEKAYGRSTSVNVFSHVLQYHGNIFLAGFLLSKRDVCTSIVTVMCLRILISRNNTGICIIFKLSWGFLNFFSNDFQIWTRRNCMNEKFLNFTFHSTYMYDLDGQLSWMNLFTFGILARLRWFNWNFEVWDLMNYMVLTELEIACGKANFKIQFPWDICWFMWTWLMLYYIGIIFNFQHRKKQSLNGFMT